LSLLPVSIWLKHSNLSGPGEQHDRRGY